MALIPDPATLVSRGAARLFRGLRTGEQTTVLTGAVIAAFGLWRKTLEPRRTLIRRETLKPGQSVVIRSHEGDTPPLRIEG